MNKPKTVFISGKISGDPDYKQKFARVAAKLESDGYIVVNPAMLPSNGFSYAAYMRMAFAMLDECDAVYFLADWESSPGAQREHIRAMFAEKQMMYE